MQASSVSSLRALLRCCVLLAAIGGVLGCKADTQHAHDNNGDAASMATPDAGTTLTHDAAQPESDAATSGGLDAATSVPSVPDAQIDDHSDGGSSLSASGASSQDGKILMWINQKNVAEDHEDHVCVTVTLPNEQTVWATAVHAQLTPGSHHLIVDRVTGGASDPTPVSCGPTMGGDDTRLMIAQQLDTTLDIPGGAAFRIEPHQAVFLQLHYINYTGKTADISGTVELTLLPTSSTPPIEARSLFTGSMSINLPAGQAGEAESFFTPSGSAATPLHVFALTSHTHSLGIDSTIERVPSDAAPTITPLHESLHWSEPPLTLFNPPLQFTGSDGLRLRCKYMNTTNQPVHFGTRFEDEMCFMWLYYY